MNVVALIPAYEETGRIGPVVREVLKHLATCLVVDDGSPDATAEEARTAGARVLRHPTNCGKGRALETGFRWVAEHRAAGALCLDGDGQHDPAEVPKFLACLARERPDIIIGARRRSPTMPPIRRFTNRFCSTVISRLAGAPIQDSQSGYRYVSLRAWRLARPKTGGFDAESEFLIRAGRRGLRICEVPIRTIYGSEKSKIRPARDAWQFMRLAFRYLIGFD